MAVTAKKMTVAEAAEAFERIKPQLAELMPEFDAAKEILLEHFKRTKRTHYKGRIGYSVTWKTVLDQDAVKTFLGKKLSKFQKRSPSRSLFLLGEKDGE